MPGEGVPYRTVAGPIGRPAPAGRVGAGSEGGAASRPGSAGGGLPVAGDAAVIVSAEGVPSGSLASIVGSPSSPGTGFGVETSGVGSSTQEIV